MKNNTSVNSLKTDVDKAYNSISKLMSELNLSEQLLIISNLLFDTYPLARKIDILYNEIDPPEIVPLENYSLLKDYYTFLEDQSYVYKILNNAHDLLANQIEIKKLMLNIKDN